jgi:hypothetical protein
MMDEGGIPILLYCTHIFPAESSDHQLGIL